MQLREKTAGRVLSLPLGRAIFSVQASVFPAVGNLSPCLPICVIRPRRLKSLLKFHPHGFLFIAEILSDTKRSNAAICSVDEKTRFGITLNECVPW